MHSFASLAIFAFSGRADFMILATGAKLRMLASESRLLDEPFPVCCTGEDSEGGEVDDMICTLQAGRFKTLVQRNGPGKQASESIGLVIVERFAENCGWMGEATPVTASLKTCRK
jgi:hypothetical protein